MSNSSTTSSGGIGICGVLFCIFLVLKLLGVTAVANWSWWWVFSPLWMPFIVLLVVMLVMGMVFLIFNK